MVAIDDIQDRASFEAWLTETERSRQECIALATRAALRALPYDWSLAIRGGRLSPIPILRANLVAMVAGLAPPRLIEDEETAATLRATALTAFTNAASSRTAAAARAAAAQSISVARVSSARVADAFRSSTVAAARTDYATRHSRRDLHPTAPEDAASASWQPLRTDCTALLNGQELATLPLFHDTPPQSFQARYETVRHALSPQWSFWQTWYEHALNGEEQDWPLLLDIALRPDEFWKGLDADVNRRIATEDRKYATAAHPLAELDPALLAMAAANSVNAEEIVITERGDFDVVPLFDIEKGPFDIAKESVQYVVDDMRTAISGSNEYSVLQRLVELLERELARSEQNPQRIFLALNQGIGDLKHYEKIGEIPPDDRRTNWFANQLRYAAGLIRDNDTEVAKAAAAFSVFQPPAISPSDFDSIVLIADHVAANSTERLAAELVSDSRVVIDASERDETRKSAIYRFGSRIVRILRLNRQSFEDLLLLGNVIALPSKLIQLVRWFL